MKPRPNDEAPASSKSGLVYALLLLLLVGGAYLWLHGGSIPTSTASQAASEQAAPALPQTQATPHPAKEATAEAVRLHPTLSQKDSPLNRKFLALFEEAKATAPQTLAKAVWPLILAARAEAALPRSVETGPSVALPNSRPLATPGYSPSDLRAMQQAMTEIYGLVVEVNQGGCWLRVKGFSGGPWIGPGASAGVGVSPILIYVEGFSGRADGEQFQDVKIYPTGQFQKRGNSTSRLYTSTAQAALRQLQNGDKSLNDVVSADHSMWLNQQGGTQAPVSSLRRIGAGGL